MKITLNKLLNPQVVEALAIIFKAKLAAKGDTLWQIVQLQKQVESIGKDFDSAKLKLFELHGEKDGDQYKVAPEKQAEFFKELNEILEKEVEVPEVKLTKDNLNNVELSSIDVMALSDAGFLTI